MQFDSTATSSGKANIMSLSRELTEADRSVRSQVVLASLNGDSDKRASECVWKENGFFGDLKSDFSIHKKDFPENALVYINQAYLSTKDGEPIVYITVSSYNSSDHSCDRTTCPNQKFAR